MKKILLIGCLIWIFPFKAYGQQKPFNCLILKKIILNIDTQKQNNALYDYIRERCTLVANSNVRDSIIKKPGYESDKTLDSILNLPNIDAILNVRFDSLFYLSKNNIILDTFRFFTPSCSCQINSQNIIVVNDRAHLPKDKKCNILIVSSLNNYYIYSYLQHRYVDYDIVKLKRNNNNKRKLDEVIFLYQIERNIPIIKEVRFNKWVE